MAQSISVVLPVSSSKSSDTIVIGAPVKPRRMTIKTASGAYRVDLPFAPKEISYDNWGVNWAQVPRDGRLPYLIMESRTLPNISFTVTIANSRNQTAPVTSMLLNLKALSETTQPLKITYGGFFESKYSWRCTKMSFKSVQRNPTSSEITVAEVDLEFTVVQDIVLSTGPVTGGVKPPKTTTPPKKKATKKKIKKKKYKTYTVKKGDTLTSIAIKLFKNASKWRYLADTNNIKNHKIKVGQKLKY